MNILNYLPDDPCMTKIMEMFVKGKYDYKFSDLLTHCGVTAAEWPASPWDIALDKLLRNEVLHRWHRISGDKDYSNFAYGIPACEDQANPPLTLMRKIAYRLGYSLGVHGSELSDFDVIAVPWTIHAVSGEVFLKTFMEELELEEVGKTEDKPHGRKAYTLKLPLKFWMKHIDLSIMPVLESK